mgnify:CR=1 FL=1
MWDDQEHRHNVTWNEIWEEFVRPLVLFVVFFIGGGLLWMTILEWLTGALIRF